MKKFFVYVDLTTEVEPRAFYVGKACIARVKKLKRNALHTKIASKYGQERVIIYETNDQQDAFEMEIATIATLKTRSHMNDDHWGSNHTDGGEGSSGAAYKLSLATREKMSGSKLGNHNRVGKNHSLESRMKIGTAHCGKTVSIETRNKIRNSILGKSKICKKCRKPGHFAKTCPIYHQGNNTCQSLQ